MAKKNQNASKPQPRVPATFKLLPDETVLPDDYPIHDLYVYIVDGVAMRYMGMGTISCAVWKAQGKHNEVRRCNLFGHPGACLGDRFEK